MVFELHQNGNALTGTVEGGEGGFFGGSDVPTPIEDGKVNGNQVSFKAGRSTYSGTMNGGRIELDRKISIPSRYRIPEERSGEGPAIGPPPDGSDPSRGASFRMPSAIPVILRRVER